MAFKVANRITYGKGQAVSKGYNHSGGGGSNRVCTYWLAGKCNRNPCRFLHEDSSKFTYNRNSKQYRRSPEDSPNRNPKLSSMLSTHKVGGSEVKNDQINKRKVIQKNEDTCYRNLKQSRASPEDNMIQSSKLPTVSTRKVDGSEVEIPQTGQQKVTQNNEDSVCEYWLSSNCVHGDKCQYMHSWFRGDGFTRLTQLEGHKKGIRGIVLPSGIDKLYSGCTDGSVRVWDCNTGKCANVINVGGEVGSLISEGPWVFVGTLNLVKAWNIQTSAEHCLTGPVGQVHAMIVGKDKLFAGCQDGTIVAWKSGTEADPFQSTTSLKGHTGAVVSFTVGANKLYSGSMDHTIKVWDIDVLQCLMTLNGHSEVVMSLVCWEEYLLSCSLDKTIKAWALNELGDIEVVYTHKEDHGVLALCGMNDSEAKPVLFCSCNDNSVRLYKLPSFTERGRLFAKKEVRSIQISPTGNFFTGDGTGRLDVWKWLEQPSEGSPGSS